MQVISLKISFTSYIILFIFRYNVKGICNPQGLEGRILKHESKKLNFKFTLTGFFGKNSRATVMEKVYFC